MRILYSLLASATFLCGITAIAHEAQAGDIKKLPGYSKETLFDQFADKMKTDEDSYNYLLQHPSVSQKIMSDIQTQSVIAKGIMTVQQLGGEDANTELKKQTDTNARRQQAADYIHNAIGQLKRGSAAPLPAVSPQPEDAETQPVLGSNNSGKEFGSSNARHRKPPEGRAGTKPNHDNQIGIIGNPPSDETTPPDDIENETTPGPLYDVVDVNAPLAAGSSVDANGWPTYLNVPADCPPPQQNIKYYHENLLYDHFLDNPNADGFGPVRPTPGGILGWNQMEPYHARHGAWFLIGMTDKEQFSIPFHTLTAGQTVALGAEGHPVPQTFFQMAYAHCPGDFTNATPAGEEQLQGWAKLDPTDHSTAGRRVGFTSAGITVMGNVVNDSSELPGFGALMLKPYKRYFLNIRPAAQVDPNLELGCDNQYLNNPEYSVAKRDGHPICWRLTDSLFSSDFYGGRYTHRPYAGPCLNTGPYPENYNSETCSESRVSECTEHNNIDVTCYDVTNEKPPQRFVRSCQNGRTMAWTEGYNKPLYTTMQCEAASEPWSANLADRWACAAHRENQLRETQCTVYHHPNAPEAAYRGYKMEQCLFNAERKRFDWTLLQSSPIPPNAYCKVRPYDRPLATDGCGFGGQNYPVGTQQTISCTYAGEALSMKRTCQTMATGAEGQGTVALFKYTDGDVLPNAMLYSIQPNCAFSYQPPEQ